MTGITKGFVIRVSTPTKGGLVTRRIETTICALNCHWSLGDQHSMGTDRMTRASFLNIANNFPNITLKLMLAKDILAEFSGRKNSFKLF